MHWKLFVASLFLFILIAEAKQRPKTRRHRQSSFGRPVELRGSAEQRIRQNTKAINLGINQVLTYGELLNLVKDGALEELKNNAYYYIDRGATSTRKVRIGKRMLLCVPKENRIFVRAEVSAYAHILARDFFVFTKSAKRLKLTSGVRSLEEQIEMRTPGSCHYTPYAATILTSPLEESLHIRGIAFDISRRVVAVVKGRLKEVSMSNEEIKWIRNRLVADKLNGVEFEMGDKKEKIGLETDPIEEKICYHVIVFPK